MKKSHLCLSHVCYVSRSKERLIKILKELQQRKKIERKQIRRDLSCHPQESGNQSGRKFEYNGTGNENEEASKGLSFASTSPHPL